MKTRSEPGVEDKSWSPLSIPAWLAVALLAYVLSVGPAVFMVDQKWINERAAETFYAPVIWAYENTVLRKPLEWHVHRWGRP